MGVLAQARRDARKLASLPLPELVASLWRLLRPAFWIVTIFPVYLGYVYASGQLLPAQELWVAWGQRLLAGGVSLSGFLGTLAAWLGRAAARRFVAALLVIGPFIWGGTLLYNDIQDLEADRAKDLRSESPLVQGYISRQTAFAVVVALSVVGMGLSLWIGPVFFGLMAVCLFLSWAYSAPPLHLKARAGWDVAVNVVGIGVLCLLAGWVLARPLEAFPWYLLAPAVTNLGAVYVPTVIADYHVDRRYGVATTAVEFGPERAFWLGFAFLVLGDLSLVGVAFLTPFLSLGFFELTWPVFVVKAAVYVGAIGRVDDVWSVWIGLGIVGALIGVLNLVFLLVYTGFWVV